MDTAKPVNLGGGDKWPYPWYEYVLRVIWSAVWLTIWQLCWKRIPLLRTTILRLFGARMGRSSQIAASVQILRPWDLRVGDGCVIGPRVHLYNLAEMVIGNDVMISQDAYICGGTHDYTDPTLPLVRRKVVIGDYAWIAAGAFIGPGITIGEGAVVGARAVVTRDVEPWTIVAGNPARVIRRRQMKQAQAKP